MLILASIFALAALDPCPPKTHEQVFPSLPAPLPGDDGTCWLGYLAAKAKCQADRTACINSISPTSPNRCVLIQQCDAVYAACMSGSEQGYVACVLEKSP